MVGKTDKTSKSYEEYVIAGTVCMILIGLSGLYFNPEIPSDSKRIVIPGILAITVIVIIILKIIKIEIELNSLRR